MSTKRHKHVRLLYICCMKYAIFVGLVLLTIACKERNTEHTATSSNPLPPHVMAMSKRVQQYPDSMDLRVAYANMLDSIGQYSAAIAQMDSVLKRDSLRNGFWVMKGQFQEKNKDTSGAIASYYKSILIYPAVDAQLYLANLLAETKDKRSLLLLVSVSKTRFDDRTLAECDFIAGIYHARTQNNPLAINLFNRCISRDFKFMEAYMEKGFIYFETKDLLEAEKVFTTAITVETTYADAWYWLAKTQEILGKKELAIKNYEQALKYDATLTEAQTAINRLSSK
jgi:tetratricopeptide (TPR) repeat protein